MNQKLEPCPCCKGVVEYTTVSIPVDGELTFHNFGCVACGYRYIVTNGSKYDAIEQANRRASPWISVKDRLPDELDGYPPTVLIYERGWTDVGVYTDFYTRGRQKKHKGWVSNGVIVTPSHWMPMPKGPEAE